MALTKQVLMPGADYQAAADQARGLSGGTDPLKSGELVTALEDANGEVNTQATKINALIQQAENLPTAGDTALLARLCPALAESGNPVTCYPVEGYQLGVAASWEPTQAGSGDPSPDNIRPITGRDSVVVKRCGENLLPEDTYTIGPYNIRTINPVEFTPGTYTLCTDSKANGVYAGDKTVYNTNALTFTVDAPKAIALNTYWSTGVPSGTTHIWIVVGSKWQPYAPYIGSTNTLTLPETIYGGTVDAVSGDGQETWKMVTLDGTEAWITPSSNAYYAAFGFAPSTKSNDGLCSHLPYAANRPAKRAYVNSNGAVVFYGYNAEMTVTQLKDWLAAQHAAGTPVQIAYKLADPIPFRATGGRPILAMKGVNTVLMDADSVAVTGHADPIRIIDELTAESAAALSEDETAPDESLEYMENGEITVSSADDEEVSV